MYYYYYYYYYVISVYVAYLYFYHEFIKLRYFLDIDKNAGEASFFN